ncbi:hypothetical protein Scep_002799 [Stephania cephalantha]|uniref:Uncharacterized protein n=1 Tax=Stephania cephalantha TaxID=152367 RepID=A0AAP0LAN1_9MAGN
MQRRAAATATTQAVSVAGGEIGPAVQRRSSQQLRGQGIGRGKPSQRIDALRRGAAGQPQAAVGSSERRRSTRVAAWLGDDRTTAMVAVRQRECGRTEHWSGLAWPAEDGRLARRRGGRRLGDAGERPAAAAPARGRPAAPARQQHGSGGDR